MLWMTHTKSTHAEREGESLGRATALSSNRSSSRGSWKGTRDRTLLPLQGWQPPREVLKSKILLYSLSLALTKAGAGKSGFYQRCRKFGTRQSSGAGKEDPLSRTRAGTHGTGPACLAISGCCRKFLQQDIQTRSSLNVMAEAPLHPSISLKTQKQSHQPSQTGKKKRHLCLTLRKGR